MLLTSPILTFWKLSRGLKFTGKSLLVFESNLTLTILSTIISEKQDKLNTRDRRDAQRIPPGGTPSYTIFNLRYGLQLTEQFLLTAAIENITDQDYRIHGSGQNEPGINFIFGASINF